MTTYTGPPRLKKSFWFVSGTSDTIHGSLYYKILPTLDHHVRLKYFFRTFSHKTQQLIVEYYPHWTPADHELSLLLSDSFKYIPRQLINRWKPQSYTGPPRWITYIGLGTILASIINIDLIPSRNGLNLFAMHCHTCQLNTRRQAWYYFLFYLNDHPASPILTPNLIIKSSKALKSL